MIVIMIACRFLDLFLCFNVLSHL